MQTGSLLSTPRAILAGLAILLVSACGSDGGGSNGGGGGGATTTEFVGILSSDDGLESGSLAVTVSTATPAPPAPTSVALAIVTASGTLTLVGGTPVALTGSYDDATGALTITGGGYSFTGVYDGSNRLEGTYTGPTTAGTFVSAQSDGTTEAFCGSYAGDDQGLWNFVIDGNDILGEAVSVNSGTSAPLDGSINGNAISILFPGTQQVLATGTRSGSTVSGTWDDPNSTDQGTWTGAACQ
jgi:hypothetical protein